MGTSKGSLSTTDRLARSTPVEPSVRVWDVWSGLVARAYAAVSRPALWNDVFAALYQTLDLHGGTGTLVLREAGEVRYVDLRHPGLGLTRLNPRDAFGAMSLSRRSFALAHLLDDDGRGDIFEDWDELSRAVLGGRHPSALEMFVHREPAWADTSRQLAIRFLPHLHGALRLTTTLAGDRRREASLRSVVERLSRALMLVDGDGRLLYANPRAMDRLALSDGLSLHEGRLKAGVDKAMRELERTIKHRARSAIGSPMCVRLQGRFEPVPLWIQSLAPGVVAILIGGAAAPPSPSSLLRKAYGLTPEESRVCFLFACGWTTREIAQRLGLTSGRTRRLLATSKAKTGVRRQVELMKLLTEAQPILS